MIEGTVPPTAWLWAVRHQPDGVRVRLWRRAASAPEDHGGASADSGSPRARRRVVGARRATDCGPSPSSGRPRSASRAPPPPREDAARRASPGPRPLALLAEGQGRSSAGAASGGRSRSPPGSSYSASESPSARPPVSAPTDPGRSMGSRGSGSDRLSGRGVYASGRMHDHLPAPDRRTPQSPPRRRSRPHSSAPRSRSRISRNREVVLTAPRDAPAWAIDPARIWMPSGIARPELPAAAPGRPRGGNRPKPSGAPRRDHPPRRRSHHAHRRRRRGDGG